MYRLILYSEEENLEEYVSFRLLNSQVILGCIYLDQCNYNIHKFMFKSIGQKQWSQSIRHWMLLRW